MALKLGKCRLCLKLGDFFSIFAVDNAVQLAEMVMECARVKIYEGDGLPDKICSECVQKLSSAYIFKQQCERCDQELRRNYVPPPGFSITPPPPTRQSSDSAFSTHTDVSNQTKPSSSNETPSYNQNAKAANRSRKRSRESIDNTSLSDRSHEYAASKRVSELRNSQKKRRVNNYEADSDYEDDNCFSPYSGGTDSDEPIIKNQFKCKECDKSFTNAKSRAIHMRIHSKKTNLGENEVVSIPKKVNSEANNEEEKFPCEKCGKSFKLNIMLKRHYDLCGVQVEISPQKELMIALEPIDAVAKNKIECDICTAKFKTIDNLQKHLRVVHAAALKHDSSPTKSKGVVSVPCIFCRKSFDDYYVYTSHFLSCNRRCDLPSLECPVCKRVCGKRPAFFVHLKNLHFEPKAPKVESTEAKKETFECRMCNKLLPSQAQLITHLAAHMSKISDMPDGTMDEDSRTSTIGDSASIGSEYGNSYVSSGPLKCNYCDKGFKYKKALDTHIQKMHSTIEIPVKVEPPDKNPSSNLLSETQQPDPSESESSQEEGDDNTCDICEKQFSYKRLLIQHKRTKHNMSSGTKRAKINLKDCLVRCLICDLEMKVSEINEHNQKHISINIKPRNVYTCADCGDKFKSCSTLAEHIKFVHRLKQPRAPKAPRALQGGSELADFCEVVVTKAEPLDLIQSHNDFGEVPGNSGVAFGGNAGEFTCPICGKAMPTLISLKRHVNWHSNVGNSLEKKVECFVCNETFRFKGHFKLHMRTHYRDPELDPKHLTCAICQRRSKHLRAAQAHMNFHKQTRFKNKDYECSICKRVFQHRKVYLSHMAIHFKRGESVQNTIVGDVMPKNADKTVFDGTHKCSLCGKVCDSENSLKHHERWHKSKSSLYGARHECYVCQLVFTNKRRLEIHTRTHYEDDNGPFKCTICGKGFIDEEYYRRHVKGHNFDNQVHKDRIAKLRKDKVKCPICARFYPDLIHLIRHLRRTHPESKMIKTDPDAPPPNYYSCKLCAKVFLDVQRLQKHEEAHLRKPTFFKCKFCGKNTTSLKVHRVHIKAHLTQKYLDDPLKCPHCDEKFNRGYDLHYHLRDVHQINETWIAERTSQTLNGPLKELQCSICLKVLASKGNFERHIDYHNTLRCNYCFDYFSSLRFLEGHLAFSCEKKKLIGDTEIYPKKIKCQECYKAFHLQVKLDCHLRTQHGIKVCREASSGKKETVCDYCFRVFENEEALTSHKIYHRTVGFYGCIYCKRKFNTLTVYRKHKTYHFSQLNVDNPTKCEHCDETFVAFREMIYHMRDVHGDDKEWITMPKDSIEETCKICNKTFFNLHKHLVYHEQNRCKKCAEYFYSATDFDNHLCSIESDDESLQNNENSLIPAYEECSFCFKPTTTTSSKAKHDHIHRGSGSISCRFCPLKFKTIDAFNIHAFSHRSRKYNKRPIKCRKCGEKFVKYGPFMKHMKSVHKSTKKMHYRAQVMPERCVVCGDDFPNLHNHYRAHLQNQCQNCFKYFTSAKLFSKHECDKEDSDPSKVFVCDENLQAHINAYVPKDLKDDEKFYGHDDEEDEEEIVPNAEETEDVIDLKPDIIDQKPIIGHDEDSQSQTSDTLNANHFSENHDDASQDEMNIHSMVSSPIISDVLSLYQQKEDDRDVVILTDDDSMDIDVNVPVITID